MAAIEAKFGEVMRQAAEVLKTQDTGPALALVEEFFVRNQPELKAYFDSKSLEETVKEMETRVSEVQAIVSQAEITDTKKVPEFLQKVKETFMEEYRKREEEMAENTA